MILWDKNKHYLLFTDGETVFSNLFSVRKVESKHTQISSPRVFDSRASVLKYCSDLIQHVYMLSRWSFSVMISTSLKQKFYSASNYVRIKIDKISLNKLYFYLNCSKCIHINLFRMIEIVIIFWCQPCKQQIGTCEPSPSAVIISYLSSNLGFWEDVCYS